MIFCRQLNYTGPSDDVYINLKPTCDCIKTPIRKVKKNNYENDFEYAYNTCLIRRSRIIT